MRESIIIQVKEDDTLRILPVGSIR